MKLPLPRSIGVPIALFIALLLFILLTNPTHLPLPLIVVPFALIFILLLQILLRIGKGDKAVHHRQRLIRAVVLASIPVLLLILQTIHQLTIKDILITIGLVTLATYYLNKADFL